MKGVIGEVSCDAFIVLLLTHARCNDTPVRGLQDHAVVDARTHGVMTLGAWLQDRAVVDARTV